MWVSGLLNFGEDVVSQPRSVPQVVTQPSQGPLQPSLYDHVPSLAFERIADAVMGFSEHVDPLC